MFHKLLILRTPGIGPVKYAALLEKFGTAEAAAATLSSDIADSVLREMDLANRLGIKYISDDSPDYPANLKKIKNHPPVISVRGNIDVLHKPSVAIVGTRHATAAGMKFTSQLGEAFAANGYSVVSGMAMGTDSAAHTGALRASGAAQTIAVLAGGADYIWPLENESLYNYICERGAIVSEMPVGSKPSTSHFIQRNRWIAGICEKLILGEADEKSGSMATAKFAIEYGRPIWAIPSHPADARSVGPNRLIKQGKAFLCEGISDFFVDKEEIKIKKQMQNNKENALIDLIGIVPQSESVLTELAKKTVAEIKAELIVLEMQGLVKKTDGGFVRV